MAAPDLIAQVDALGHTSFAGSVLRHVSVERDPLSGIGARIQGGRWNPPDSFSTIYSARDRATVIAEFHRAAHRQGLSADDFLPRELHTLDVRLEAVLDLRSSEARLAVGIKDEDIRGDDLRKCQAVGEAAHYVGLEGILAPSATGPGEVLVIFLDRLRHGSRVDPSVKEEWETAPEE